MRRNLAIVGIFALITVASAMPLFVLGQDSGVYAEAVGQANLRARPDLNSAQVGEISVGTIYPILGRSEFYPWVLLGNRDSFLPVGWVFVDLVTVYGDLNQVPFSSVDVNEAPRPTVTLTPIDLVAAQGGNIDQIIVSTATAPTLTPTANFQVRGAVLNEINVRYGPGVDYPALNRAFEGDVFEITAYHTQFPWVQVRYTDSPNGFAWIAADLLDITGDLYRLPAITTTRFDLPELTPTPSVRQASDLPGQAAQISPQFAALGDRIWNLILDADFLPESTRFGAVYLQDLQTGEAITFGNDIAFSGTSINKIPILLEYFDTLDGYPNGPEAVDVANTMICSENVATNRLLSVIGDGDQILGAEDTTQLLHDLGLQNTFLTAPFEIPSTIAPTPPPRPIIAPETEADQTRANPNPTNQMTVDEMGYLLSTVYDCAYHEAGSLIANFDNKFTPQECRKALHIMSNNTVDALLKAGVPVGIRVAHKHGWINDTHGNAAVIFTPGGDYVLVMMLYQPTWLDFSESLPLIAEVSREVYNYYNPNEPLAQVRQGYIPTVDECNYTFDDPLVGEISSPFFLDLNDTSLFYQPANAPIDG
jgi:uncharacterized protein YraI/beta-lactamase class A